MCSCFQSYPMVTHGDVSQSHFSPLGLFRISTSCHTVGKSIKDSLFLYLFFFLHTSLRFRHCWRYLKVYMDFSCQTFTCYSRNYVAAEQGIKSSQDLQLISVKLTLIVSSRFFFFLHTPQCPEFAHRMVNEKESWFKLTEGLRDSNSHSCGEQMNISQCTTQINLQVDGTAAVKELFYSGQCPYFTLHFTFMTIWQDTLIQSDLYFIMFF